MEEIDRGKKKPQFSGDVGYAEVDDHSVSHKTVDDHSSQDVHIDDHSVKTTKVSDHSQRNLHVDDHSHRTRVGDHLGSGAQKTKVNGDKIDASGVEKFIINKTSNNAPLYVVIVLVAIVAIVAVVYMVTATDRADNRESPTPQQQTSTPVASQSNTPVPNSNSGLSNQKTVIPPSSSIVSTSPTAVSKPAPNAQNDMKPVITYAFNVGFGMYRYRPDGTSEYIREGDSLFSGDGYYFVVHPNIKSYVYLYQVDSSGHAFRLFPNQKYETGQNPIAAKQDKIIPNSTMEFFLDETSGTEEILFFASKKPIIDLENFSTGLRESLPLEGRRHRGVAGIREKEKEYTHIKNDKNVHQKLLEIGSSVSEFYHRFSFNHK